MTLDGADLFVADTGSNEVTELDATTGRLVRTVNSPGLALAEPRRDYQHRRRCLRCQ